MARRKRRSGGLGAVAKHGGQFSGKNRQHQLKVCVAVHRNIGASTARQYVAEAQPCKGTRMGRNRYAQAVGRTPTAATKKVLRALATKLK